ncbi:membrane hypothetical protein, involved in Hassallidin biosynthesis [Planktothrix serta PCC 8927]|uniref:Glycosyltransferase RgtA/B/C/D-like domain-containing protein n=2 Tax=Planktothrix TaxID=54304 RepID=A0A1J1JM52_9CYAN|nr:membrane hypothetical protein, involved in Hassallidin biosynthesis [Planktothrix serta PCC 8927]VXD10540.1 membrane hypothetical protein, involved in Hassallidin biosynthesis [Planktothrix serta PCC 8927]
MVQSQLGIKTHPSILLKVIVLILIGLGLFFHFAHLGQKFYCGDETWTSVAISGHTLVEIQQELAQHQDLIPITALQKYQHLNPDQNVFDTVNYLITSDPQHPPLYYVLVRLWAQIFGDSPAGVRSLSVILSLLIFPSAYWLCVEMFESAVVGWIAMALIAVSPLQLFLAQEARQYGLWMVEILLSSATLLRAVKQKGKVNWIAYTLTLTLGLYTHLFTILVMIAHGIYVIIEQQFRFTKTLLNYLLFTSGALLMFVPWLVVLITYIHTAVQQTSGWSIRFVENPFELIAIFLIRIARTFFDFNLTSSDLGMGISFALEGSMIYTIFALVLSLVLVSYLIAFLVKSSINKNWILLALVGGLPATLLIIADLFLGGIRSLQIRYQLPLCLSLEILTAYFIAYLFFQEQEAILGKRISQIALAILLTVGLISDVKFFQSENWWTQTSGKFITETALVINNSENSLLVINPSPVNLGGILALSNYLSKVDLLPVVNDVFQPIPQDYTQIFFMQHNNSLFQQIEQDKNYALKVIVVFPIEPGGLWQFTKIS